MLLRYRIRFWLRRVTPLTWLIWALLAADLAAPGYLKFNFLIATVDAQALVAAAIEQAGTATDSVGEAEVRVTGKE